jgi:hypothetical protein
LISPPSAFGRIPAAGIVLGLSTVLLCSSAAGASYDPLGSGSTAITFSKPFVRLLASHHVKLEARGGARKAGRSIVLPAAGGEVDARLGTGTVEGAGTIVFVAGKRRLPFRDVTFKAKRAPLYAKIGGGQLKIATGARLSSKRVGFGAGFSATGLRLTSKVATRLNKKLHLGKALDSGLKIGEITARGNPATVHLRQEGRLSMAIDPAFFAKLNRLFVSLNPIAPAELAPGPVLSFPVGPESTLAPDGRSGTVKLTGSVELLQLGSAQIFWHEVWLEPAAATLLAEVDAEPSPPNAGKQPQAELLALPAGAAISSNPARREIAIAGQPAILTAAAAAALNAGFAKGAQEFAAGELVGSISLSVAAE